MSFIRSISGIVNGVQEHPLSSDIRYRMGIYGRILSWQFTKKAYSGGKVVPWINDLKLWITPGRSSVVGNYYYGLYEYEPEAFLYHYISEDDVVFDIGANAGAYTVLFSAAKKVYAFEPGSDTFEVLKKNIEINNMVNAILVNKGVSDKDGKLLFTKGLDCVNHIVDDNEEISGTESIDVVSLDSFTSESNCIPSVIKIDTEGAEERIITGGLETLKNPKVNIVVMEIFGSKKLSDMLSELGFKLYSYDVRKHTLVETVAAQAGDNGIYVKDIQFTRQRLQNARNIFYLGKKLD